VNIANMPANDFRRLIRQLLESTMRIHAPIVALLVVGHAIEPSTARRIRMKLKTSHIAIAAPALALLFTTCANAVITIGNGQSINLATILAAGSDRKVIIDDKMFTFNTFTSGSFAAQSVTVVGYISSTTNSYGLRNVGFDLTGQFGDFIPGDGRSAEMNLRYTVEVLPYNYDRDVRICDTHLAFDGVASGIGSYARVDETVFDLDTNDFLGNLSAFDIAGTTQTTRRTDVADYCDMYGTHGYRAFQVNKDIKFLAAFAGGSSSATSVRQEFSQILAPSPGALALLGGAGIIGLRRRRN
jgi:hypothetical protein